jgi:hypothetical protein
MINFLYYFSFTVEAFELVLWVNIILLFLGGGYFLIGYAENVAFSPWYSD